MNHDRTPPSRMATRHQQRVGGRGSEGPGPVWRTARLPVTQSPAPEAVWWTRTSLQGSEARQRSMTNSPGAPWRQRVQVWVCLDSHW